MINSIIIVDDHNLFAQSLKGLIASFENFEVVEVFKNGQELIDYLSTAKDLPDIILLDVRMPVMNVIENMDWIKSNMPDKMVLSLTITHDEVTIIKNIK